MKLVRYQPPPAQLWQDLAVQVEEISRGKKDRKCKILPESSVLTEGLTCNRDQLNLVMVFLMNFHFI